MIQRRDDHLPWRWLADLGDGVLAPERAAEAEAHLASGCAPCCARRESLRRIVAAIASGAPAAAPADVDRRVLAALARARRSGGSRRDAGPLDSGQSLVGEVVLDQRLDLAFSLRSAGADTRKILWRLGPWDVDASVVSAGGTHDGRCDLLGQFVRTNGDGAAISGEVRILRGRRVAARTTLAPDGRFTFRNVAPGACAIEGVVSGLRFSLPPLVID